MRKKIICLLLIIILSSTSLTGCYSSRGLETLAYAVAIGIDKGDGDNKIKLTLPLAVLSDSSSEGGRKYSISAIYCY